MSDARAYIVRTSQWNTQELYCVIQLALRQVIAVDRLNLTVKWLRKLYFTNRVVKKWNSVGLTSIDGWQHKGTMFRKPKTWFRESRKGRTCMSHAVGIRQILCTVPITVPIYFWRQTHECRSSTLLQPSRPNTPIIQRIRFSLFDSVSALYKFVWWW